MKTLTLLRHAESSSSGPGQKDFERPLSARGRRDALAIGAEMARLGLAFDLILGSPAKRASETLAEAAVGYCALSTRFDERLYLATANTLLLVIQQADDSCGSLLIVGHNPGIEQLALLLDGDGTLRNLMAREYPAGALAELQFEIAGWSDVDASRGRLARFIRPGDLDRAEKPGS